MKSTDIIGKNYLTNFLVVFILVLMVGITISAFVLYLNIYQPLNTHYSAVLSIMSDLKDNLIYKSIIISAFFSLLMLVSLLIIGILYTHRIAGPLYRVKMAAKSVGNGDLNEKIKLRKKDVIHNFAETLNEMTDTYNDKIKEISLEVNQLKDAVNELEHLPDEEKSSGAAARKISDINLHINSIIADLKL